MSVHRLMIKYKNMPNTIRASAGKQKAGTLPATTTTVAMTTVTPFIVVLNVIQTVPHFLKHVMMKEYYNIDSGVQFICE